MLVCMITGKDLQRLGREIEAALDGRTQTWLEDAMQKRVTQSTISRLMRGQVKNPDARTIVTIARALGRNPIPWLRLAGVGLPTEAEHLDDEALYIAARISALPDAVRPGAVDALGAVLDNISDISKSHTEMEQLIRGHDPHGSARVDDEMDEEDEPGQDNEDDVLN